MGFKPMSASANSISVATLGAPRIGPRRELKFALEKYWSGKIMADDLLEAAAGLRVANWARQHSAGVTVIPSNDFSLYDHVLDISAMVGAIPDFYGWRGGSVPLDTYFAMARGSQENGQDVPALEMTKWFDTNYHYIVPELKRWQEFTYASSKPVDEFLEAKALGYHTRPVLLGPVTYLLLAKSKDAAFSPLALLDGLLPVYAEVLRQLGANGADWVQMDEPCLVLDQGEDIQRALKTAYETLAAAAPGLKIMLTTYFGSLGGSLATALGLPVAGLHVDLARAPEQLGEIARSAPSDMVLSLGAIDGRNVWRADLGAILDRLEPVEQARGEDLVQIAPSCSLLHVPIDLELETGLDPELKSWLAFAAQKMDELATLGIALAQGRRAVSEKIGASGAVAERRRTSSRTNDEAVARRTGSVKPEMSRRKSPFASRAKLQHDLLKLPPFPTTTIGSFPQTKEVRKARADHAKGAMNDAEYESFLKSATKMTVRWQEEIGLDVLVHGEFERNDMVQYFGEQLSGFAFTKHGWVQSYGSRYVRPPIIFGDVSRPQPMTVQWWEYAQSLTDKPMKGMLTGPVTILNWSFVRDDIRRSATCRQIALAIRDEVHDLERAGARIIQIDEAALREGLPLRKRDWRAYLDWAVQCFRLTASGVKDETQIHTHMCYSEFNDIIESIGEMDADVISIETSRSRMELLDAFVTYHYPNEIGPGVYDIHSPRIPAAGEMEELLQEARKRLSADQLWVNPDCGLKTRNWDEVRPALENMVEAARSLRSGGGGA